VLVNPLTEGPLVVVLACPLPEASPKHVLVCPHTDAPLEDGLVSSQLVESLVRALVSPPPPQCACLPSAAARVFRARACSPLPGEAPEGQACAFSAGSVADARACLPSAAAGAPKALAC